jgi:hypothetical protein
MRGDSQIRFVEEPAASEPRAPALLLVLLEFRVVQVNVDLPIVWNRPCGDSVSGA